MTNIIVNRDTYSAFRKAIGKTPGLNLDHGALGLVNTTDDEGNEYTYTEWYDGSRIYFTAYDLNGLEVFSGIIDFSVTSYNPFTGEPSEGTISAINTYLPDGENVLEISNLNLSLSSFTSNDDIPLLIGNDFISATNEDDVLNAALGDDTIYGYDGDDVINGQGGDDIIWGGPGDDLLNGGSGEDIVLYWGNESYYSIELKEGSRYVTDLVTGDVDELVGFEFVEFYGNEKEADNTVKAIEDWVNLAPNNLTVDSVLVTISNISYNLLGQYGVKIIDNYTSENDTLGDAIIYYPDLGLLAVSEPVNSKTDWFQNVFAALQNGEPLKYSINYEDKNILNFDGYNAYNWFDWIEPNGYGHTQFNNTDYILLQDDSFKDNLFLNEDKHLFLGITSQTAWVAESFDLKTQQVISDGFLGDSNNNTFSLVDDIPTFFIFDGKDGYDTFDLKIPDGVNWTIKYSFDPTNPDDSYDKDHTIFILDAEVLNITIGTSATWRGKSFREENVIFGDQNDTVYIKSGVNDLFDAGGGRDKLKATELGEGIKYSTLGGTVEGLSTGFVHTVENFERIYGSEYDDIFIGKGSAFTVPQSLTPDFIAKVDNRVGDGSLEAMSSRSASTEVFYPGLGNDVIQGGSGYSSVHYYAHDDYLEDIDIDPIDILQGLVSPGIRADLETGQIIDPGGFTDSVTGIEEVIGTEYEDRLFGNDGFNFFTPRGGGDYIDGRGGVDGVSYWWGFDNGIQARLNENRVLYGDNLSVVDTVYDIEYLYGSLGNDSIWASNEGNLIYGADGDDYIMGGNGADFLRGNLGNDSLYGGSGNDNLSGGSGNNIIDGEDGADVISLEGSRSDYVITKLQGLSNYSIDHIEPGKAKNTVKNVEKILFYGSLDNTKDDFLIDIQTAFENPNIIEGTIDQEGAISIEFSVLQSGDVRFDLFAVGIIDPLESFDFSFKYDETQLEYVGSEFPAGWTGASGTPVDGNILHAAYSINGMTETQSKIASITFRPYTDVESTQLQITDIVINNVEGASTVQTFDLDKGYELSGSVYHWIDNSIGFDGMVTVTSLNNVSEQNAIEVNLTSGAFEILDIAPGDYWLNATADASDVN